MLNSPLQESREAMGSGRWKEARHLLEHQLQQNPTAEVFEELAKACWWLNDFTALFDYRLRAYEAFIRSDDKRGAARNAGWLGIDYLEIKGEFAIANGWFQRAANLLQDADDCWELAFITLLKARIYFMQHPTNDVALQLVEESISISKRVGSIDGEMVATGVKGLILTTEGKINEGMSCLDEATLIATTAEVKEVSLAGITCCFLIEACQRVRDYERAGQWCNKVKELARRWHFDALFSSCRTNYASVLIWKGEWEAAEQELLLASKELEQLRPSQISMCLAQLAELRRRQGRWKEVNELLQQAQVPAAKLLACAAFAYDQGDFATAAEMTHRFIRQIPDKEKIRKLAAIELLIRIYCKQEKTEEANHLLNELKEIAEIVNTQPINASFLSSSGVVHEACGNTMAARENLEDAIDIYDTIDAPFESAVTRILLSEVLIRLQQYRNAETALKIALKAFEKMGAEKYIEKAKQLLKTVHRQHALEQKQDVPEFTGRELEILRLLAEGKNNEEIAQQLFLSVRTIEKHLTNLYLKMGVSGKSARAFAASYAVKRKLFFT
ncbi:MAG TPA: LuxR C-terminal-related transcriptional regulator [Acidobacteriota bacterium]|jgi:DNA-binding CsgD family transcriptional regulator